MNKTMLKRYENEIKKLDAQLQCLVCSKRLVDEQIHSTYEYYRKQSMTLESMIRDTEEKLDILKIKYSSEYNRR